MATSRSTVPRTRTPLFVAIVQLLALFCAVKACSHESMDRAMWIVAMLSCLVVVLLALGDANRVQDERDAIAAKIVNNAIANSLERTRYIVLLRSFHSPRHMLYVTASDPTWTLLRALPGDREGFVSVETALADALWMYAPVVGLDIVQDDFGIGRATVPDEKWELIVERLMLHADTIVVIPGVTPGLRREYSVLRTLGLLNKTLIVMPPCDIDVIDDCAHMWREASDIAYVDLGVRLPAYEHSGLLFVVDDRGNPEAWIQFPESMTTEALSTQLRRIRRQLTSMSAGGSRGPANSA